MRRLENSVTMLQVFVLYNSLVLQGPGHRPESFMYIPWDLRLIQFDAGGTGAGGALVLLASIA